MQNKAFDIVVAFGFYSLFEFQRPYCGNTFKSLNGTNTAEIYFCRFKYQYLGYLEELEVNHPHIHSQAMFTLHNHFQGRRKVWKSGGANRVVIWFKQGVGKSNWKSFLNQTSFCCLFFHFWKNEILLKLKILLKSKNYCPYPLPVESCKLICQNLWVAEHPNSHSLRIFKIKFLWSLSI